MIEFTDREFEELTSFVKVNYGINLAGKKSFAEMRLGRLMEENDYDTFTGYFDFVCSDISGVAISAFISALTINYTLFYRESYHFDFLAREVLPHLYRKEQTTKDLRIWSAGCATGEEPYTIAMIVSDFLGMHRSLWDMKILATDISTVALKKGIAATYPDDSIDSLNPYWIRNYFVKDTDYSGTVTIAPTIKDEVIFRKLNLIGDSFNFKKKFHFIFCRNVMIYFDEPTKNRLIKKFCDVLEDGGYLFIGMSETIERNDLSLKYVMPSVYRKEVSSL